MNFIKKILTLTLALTLFACAGNIGANQYETRGAGQINTAAEGVIINVRAVNVATEGGTGELAGAIAGGAAGSMIGGNTAMNIIGAVGGAVLGGALGNKAEQGLSGQTGFEYVVKLDSGKTITLTQGTDVHLSVGQKVYVLDGGTARARIIPKD